MPAHARPRLPPVMPRPLLLLGPAVPALARGSTALSMCHDVLPCVALLQANRLASQASSAVHHEAPGVAVLMALHCCCQSAWPHGALSGLGMLLVHLSILGKAEEHAGVYAGPRLVLLLQAQQLVLHAHMLKGQMTEIVWSRSAHCEPTWKFQTWAAV